MKYIHTNEINFTKKALLMKRLNSIDLLLNKYKNSCEIVEDLDSIIYFLHDDVERIMVSRKRPLTWDAYSYSLDVTRTQILHKQHLGGVKRFMQLEAASALRWLLARLTNNAINYYCVESKKLNIEDVYHEESLLYDLIDIDSIKERNPKLFQEVFERLSKDALFRRDGFDFYDFEYLCAKYGLDLSEYMLSPFSTSAEISKSGGAQLLFGFDEQETDAEIKNSLVKRLNVLKKHKRIKQGRLF